MWSEWVWGLANFQFSEASKQNNQHYKHREQFGLIKGDVNVGPLAVNMVCRFIYKAGQLDMGSHSTSNSETEFMSYCALTGGRTVNGRE